MGDKASPVVQIQECVLRTLVFAHRAPSLRADNISSASGLVTELLFQRHPGLVGTAGSPHPLRRLYRAHCAAIHYQMNGD